MLMVLSVLLGAFVLAVALEHETTAILAGTVFSVIVFNLV